MQNVVDGFGCYAVFHLFSKRYAHPDDTLSRTLKLYLEIHHMMSLILLKLKLMFTTKFLKILKFNK